MKNQLVQTTTKDDLVLNGLFVEGAKDKPVLLFIHGFESDFYTHKFIHLIAERSREENYSFLSVQTRGTGRATEFKRETQSSSIIGSCYELLEDAYKDIDAWINWLSNKGFEEVILLGHSLGTIKITRYLTEGTYKDKVDKLVLLAPFDKNGQEELVTGGKWREYVKLAQDKVSKGNGRELIPDYYEEVPMSYQTFSSWYQEDELGCMFDVYIKDYEFPVLNRIQIPLHIIVGTKDEYFHRTNPDHPEEAMEILLKNLQKGSGELIQDAKHSFRGFESELVEALFKFII